MLINKKFMTKTATSFSFSFLFAVLLLLSLPGESADITASQEPTLSPSAFSTPTGGFSYNAWRDTGKPIEEEWASGTFILKTPSSDLYRSRLSAAWREAAASALDITPLVREQLLLHANNKKTNTATSLSDYGNAALLNFVDKTTDSLLGGLLDSGRSLNWVKTLDGEFRVQSGKRPWSLGLGGILSLHENQDSAIGLQFFGNSGENNRGYSGLFYRRALGEEHLLGINTFVDYEEDTERNDDGFWRWTLGGEWRTNWADIRANHYLGLTEAKRQSNGAYLYTADGSDIALNLHAPQASWLSGELKYYQWDGQYGDADEQGIKYGVQVSPIGIPGFKFNIGYDNPLDGKGLWEGGFSWTHHFGESASSGGGLRFNAQDNLYESSRSSDTRQRIREAQPQTPLAFNPESLDMTLSYPLTNYILLGNLDSLVAGGQGSIRYAVGYQANYFGAYIVWPQGAAASNLVLDLNVAKNTNGVNQLWWDTTGAGNFGIPVVATDEAGARATLQLNVKVEDLSLRASGVLSITLGHPVRNYLLLPDVGSFFTGGRGNISYAVSRNDVSLTEADGVYNLWWSVLPAKGYHVYNIVATDGAGSKATLQLIVDVKLLHIHSRHPTVTVSFQLPLESYSILPNVDSLFTGGKYLYVDNYSGGSGYYELDLRYHSENGVAGVVKNSNGRHDLSWNHLPTTSGDVVINVVATDRNTGDSGLFGLFATPSKRAVSRVIVRLESISAIQDSLDMTLSLPLSNPILLPDVDSFFSGGRAGGTSYAVHPSSSAGVVLVGNDLYWNNPRAGNFSIPIVATDTAGYKATLQLNVKLKSITNAPDAPAVLEMTLSLPLKNYLLLDEVDSFFTGGVGSISYEESSQYSNLYTFYWTHVARLPEGTTPSDYLIVDLNLEKHTDGARLWWNRFPTQPGPINISIIATDEVGGKATLQLKLDLGAIATYTPPPPRQKCSFFSGCPRVGFDGAKPGALGNPGRADWKAINEPLALSLIAAGADVNEVSSVEGDTPLLAIARYGNPAVAWILLTKGADVNAVAVVTDPSNNVVYSDIGVLDYVIRNASVNVSTLVSLFIDYGVDVNLQTRADGVPSMTPLDRFNSRSRPVAAAAIKAAGGKCREHCIEDDIILASCSFFSGCSRVGFDGAKPGALGNPGRADWRAMNAPLVLSLIALGADVNEVSSIEGDTPLLAVARYGSPAMASVLLANGADINAVAIVTDPSNNAVYSDIGVLDYVIRNDSANTAPLVSLFIDHGVDVNLQTRADGVPSITPLDRFNSRSRPAAAAAIKAAGGKCRDHCRTDDISL